MGGVKIHVTDKDTLVLDDHDKKEVSVERVIRSLQQYVTFDPEFEPPVTAHAEETE